MMPHLKLAERECRKALSKAGVGDFIPPNPKLNSLIVYGTLHTMKYRMPRIRFLWAFASLFTLLVVVGGAHSTAAEDLDRFSWKGPIAESGMLRIENPFGDVRLRYGGDSGEIEVAAVLQQLRSDGIHLEIEVSEDEGSTLVAASWATKPGMELPSRPAGDLTRADLAILIPKGASVVVDVPFGLVETRGVRGDVQIRTQSGDVRIHRHFGAVSVSTVSGSIEAVLLTGETEADQVFESATGPIEVWISADAKHRASLSTSGSITTDFTLQISHDDDSEPDKVGVASLGGGGPELRLISRRGSLSLRRVPLARRVAE